MKYNFELMNIGDAWISGHVEASIINDDGSQSIEIDWNSLTFIHFETDMIPNRKLMALVPPEFSCSVLIIGFGSEKFKQKIHDLITIHCDNKNLWA